MKTENFEEVPSMKAAAPTLGEGFPLTSQEWRTSVTKYTLVPNADRRLAAFSLDRPSPLQPGERASVDCHALARGCEEFSCPLAPRRYRNINIRLR